MITSDSYLPEALAGQQSKLARRLSLSPREVDIAALMTYGLSERRIAATLGISSHTVHTLIGRIYNKLHVHNRSQALVRILMALDIEGDQSAK